MTSPIFRRAAVALALAACSAPAWASESRGIVSFAGVPVPGATVTVTQGGKKFVTVTDTQGFYIFPDSLRMAPPRSRSR